MVKLLRLAYIRGLSKLETEIRKLVTIALNKFSW